MLDKHEWPCYQVGTIHTDAAPVYDHAEYDSDSILFSELLIKIINFDQNRLSINIIIYRMTAYKHSNTQKN